MIGEGKAKNQLFVSEKYVKAPRNDTFVCVFHSHSKNRRTNRKATWRTATSNCTGICNCRRFFRINFQSFLACALRYITIHPLICAPLTFHARDCKAQWACKRAIGPFSILFTVYDIGLSFFAADQKEVKPKTNGPLGSTR